MLHDEQLFAGVQARIGLYLLVGQRTKFLAAALGEEERAVDDVIRYTIAIPQEAVFRQTEEFGFFVAQQQNIMIFKRCHSYGEALCLIGEYVTITDIGDYNHNRRGKEKDNYER